KLGEVDGGECRRRAERKFDGIPLATARERGTGGERSGGAVDGDRGTGRISGQAGHPGGCVDDRSVRLREEGQVIRRDVQRGSAGLGKLVPLVGELTTQIEALIKAGIDGVDQHGVHERAELSLHGGAESAASVAGCVAQPEHNVTDGAVVELRKAPRKLQAPTANGAGVFEGEVALIMEVEFEKAAVVIALAGGDGLD